MDLDASGTIKTASTWPFVPFSTENALKIEKLTENEKAAALLQLLKNANQDIVRTEAEEKAE